MNITIVMLIGAVLGALGGVGIFFEPREPYKVEILLAATLKGILVSLLTALSLGGRSSWWQGRIRIALRFQFRTGNFFGQRGI